MPTIPATRLKSLSAAKSVAWWRCATEAIRQSTMPRGVISSPATPSVDLRCGVEISDGIKSEQSELGQESTQVHLTLVSPTPSNDFHHYRLGHGQVPVTTDQLLKTADLPDSRGAVVLHPCGGVCQDHDEEGPASEGIPSMACAPRIARASSRVIGCPARWRRARSTASVFDRTPKRSMIACR